jgi:hypothetical protein
MFRNSLRCVHVSVYVSLLSLLGNGSVNENPIFAARQQLGINVTAATNTHATIEELLDA